MQSTQFMFGIITWNPDPIIVEIAGFALRWYSLLFATGFILSFFLLRREFIKEGAPDDLLDKMLMYSVIGTILGARIGNCLFYDFAYFSEHPLEILLPVKFEPELHFTGFRGLASHGAMLGLLASYWLLSRRSSPSMWWFLDKAALVAALCLACIRMGNFMNGEIVGAPTDVSWAIIFPAVDMLPRHPVQLYGFVLYLSLFIFIFYYYKRHQSRLADGYLFGLFLVLLGTLRFGMEFLKRHYVFADESLLNMAQYLSLPMILAGFIIIVQQRSKPKENAFKPR